MSDWYVDGSRPASGTGTSAGAAFKTLAEGAAAMAAGDTLHVAGGTYRERFEPPAGVTVAGDPANRFIISGGEALPGLAPCVSGDAAIIGDAWTSTWKTTVATSLFPASSALPGGDAEAGNLCENGVQMPLASERVDMSETFFLRKPANYLVAEFVETSGSAITGFKLAAITDNYTKAQLELSKIHFIVEPNVGVSDSFTFNTSDKFMRMNGSGYQYENNVYKDSFALFNLPAAIRPGEWAYTQSGSNTTVYVRPVDPANVGAGLIEYAARKRGLALYGKSGVTMAHFIVGRQGCPVKQHCPITLDGSDDVTLFDWRVESVSAPANGGYAGLYAVNCDRLHIHDFEITRAQGMSGFFLAGSGASLANWPYVGVSGLTLPFGASGIVTGARSGASVAFSGTYISGGRLFHAPGGISGTFQNGENLLVGGSVIGTYSSALSNTTNAGNASLVTPAKGGHIHDFDMEFIGRQGFFAYTCEDLAVHHGRIARASEEAHVNTLNLYDQCRNVLIWGVNGQDSGGYVTWQEGDGFVFAFCAFSANSSSSGGHRAIAQQQNILAQLPGEVDGWITSAVLNCRCIPFPDRVSDTRYGNSLVVSSQWYPDHLFTVYNNIFQGHSGETFAAIADWDFNINTQVGGPGEGNVGPNDVTSDYSFNYTDAANGDFTYRPSAPVRSFVGKNWSTLIPGFKARWPQVPGAVFETDMLGDVIDWARPTVGPTVDLDADYGVAGTVVAPPSPPPTVPAPPTLSGRRLRLSVTVAAP